MARSRRCTTTAPRSTSRSLIALLDEYDVWHASQLAQSDPDTHATPSVWPSNALTVASGLGALTYAQEWLASLTPPLRGEHIERLERCASPREPALDMVITASWLEGVCGRPDSDDAEIARWSMVWINRDAARLVLREVWNACDPTKADSQLLQDLRRFPDLIHQLAPKWRPFAAEALASPLSELLMRLRRGDAGAPPARGDRGEER